ncbi:MAG TPA: RNase adapter RapZ [Acidimicrobiales bacterium]|nr:RNase adapter RapZ [Acidimicrobiales bacterium]
MIDYLLVTGMSGAGRSTAAAALEDAGWYVIDNMPPWLLSAVADAEDRLGTDHDQVALVMGRGGAAQMGDVLPAVKALESQGHRVRVVYLDASQEVLVRRYEGTRRRHPVTAASVDEAIASERRLLEPIRERADVVLDTGELNVNQLRTRVLALFGEPGEGLQTTVVSFGYKHGLPHDADLVFDCRFLPNPHWVDQLRPMTGLDEPVRTFVLGHDETGRFLDQVDDLLSSLVPAFVAEGKSYLTIALGCTGGRHRSVVLAEELARRLSGRGVEATVFHRDVDR